MENLISNLKLRPFSRRSRVEKKEIIWNGRPMPILKQKVGNRTFHKRWYEKLDWLCGCGREEKLYCWPCFLFDPKAKQSWTDTGYKGFKNILSDSKIHAGSFQHLRSYNCWKSYGKECELDKLCEVQKENFLKIVKGNREYLKGLPNDVLCMRKQELPLRGREEGHSSLNKVPDLNERLGIEGSSVPTKEGSSSNFLTCSPLLSSMPGIHEDALSLGAGPSSSIQSTNDNDADYQDEIDVKAEPVFNVEPEICEEENSQSNTQLSTDRRSHQSSPTPSMIGPYLLKKETHCTTILDQLLRDDTFSDVTLTAEGQSIRAHKIVLCLASAYFRQVLSKESNVQNVIVFRDVKFMELKNLINFIYTGEATVDAADLESFMKTAEMLEVTSLCDGQRNFPKNLFPKSKEVESEKAPSSSPSKTHFSSAKRSLASSSAVSNGSPPRKTRKTDSKDKKSSAALSLPSTSGGGTLRSNNCITEPISTIIKTEPVLEDSNVDEDYELKIGTDVSFESLTRSPPPLHSSRVSTDLVENQSPTSDSLNNETATLEKVPVGKCPFCPSSQPIRKGSELSKHMYTHHQEKAVFCCENCSRVFLKKGSFEAHKDDCQ